MKIGTGKAEVRSMLRLPISLMILAALLSCGNKEDQADGLLIGPAASSVGGAYYFNGYVDRTYTTSCGSAGAAIAQTTSTTTTTTPTTGTTKEKEQTTYGIQSYYIFKNGETLSLKYDYYKNKDNFTFSPLNATSTTCSTDDLKTCSSVGRFTCTTSDNINCGGTYTFIFTSTSPVALGFQGVRGPLKWKTFTLNAEGNAVNSATLQFDMIGSDGSIFKGTVECNLLQ
ncbi:MAG: hypothetical protein K8S54_03245 [Spirochaetia bacterium]|nr:hypothetical protein [Spirochaetia bacterium]